MTVNASKVRSVVAKQLDMRPQDVDLEMNLRDDLEATDADLLKVAMVLEDMFDMDIPNHVAVRFETTQDIIDHVA